MIAIRTHAGGCRYLIFFVTKNLMIDQNEKDKAKEIVMVAKDIFAAHGFKKTTLEDITHHLNIVKSAIYHYYKSKEDLFCSVMEYEIDLFFNKLDEDISRRKSTEEKIVVYCINLFDRYEHLTNLYSISVEDINMNYENISKIQYMFFQNNIDLLSSILKQDKGLKSRKDIKTIAKIFIFCIRGMIRNSRDEKPEKLKHELKMFAGIFLKGIQS